MADTSYILATVHPGSAASAAPLPIRERSGMHASTAMGHAVRLTDFALLMDLLEERYFNGVAEKFDIYPNGVKFASWSAMMDITSSLTYAWPGSRIDDGRRYATSYLDMSWTFGSERIENGQEYSYSPYLQHAQELVFSNMSPSRPRALDDLRRRYYDVKRMHRIVLPGRYISLTQDWWAGYGWNNTSVQPREYDWQEGSCGKVAVDWESVFHTDVARDERFNPVPKYILAMINVHNADAEADEDHMYYLTQWLPVSEDGAIDTSGITKDACRAIWQREIGSAGPNESWARAEIWTDVSGKPMIVYDITWPNDEVLVPWQWEPTI